jgi:carboxyl-terminal processing protease
MENLKILNSGADNRCQHQCGGLLKPVANAITYIRGNQMKTNKLFYATRSILICLALISFNQIGFAQATAPTKETTVPVEEIQRFATVIAEIKQFYVQPIEDKKLFDNAIRGMLVNLDPHSTYLDANDLRDLKTITTGEFGGIGVEVMPENGFLKVISPLDDTPASKAGIKPGDLIVRIDHKLVKDMKIDEAVNLIRGKKDSKVTLTLIRKGDAKPINLSLTREVIKVQVVKSKLLEPGYGYVRLAFFQSTTKAELDKALQQLQQQSGGHLKGLVLDMRNNPGGLLDAAVETSETFLDSNNLPGKKLVVYTKGRIAGQDIEAKANGVDMLHGTPMVVLINEGSASASEIVAGALQDYKRALIVGTKSFGKGSVQTVIPVDKQSAIKLTTSLYYTPSGRSIQAKGIEPDVLIADMKIPNSNTEEVAIEPVAEADLAGHLKNGTVEKDKDTASEKNAAGEKTIAEAVSNELEKTILKEKALARSDFQLYQALNLLKGLHAANKAP